MIAISRLGLTDFRNYADALIEPGPGFVVLTGENGAGKTNILEAVSLLTPGRGLRSAPLSDMARTGGPGGFAVNAVLGSGPNDLTVGTGTSVAAPDRRAVRINGAPASINGLAEWLSILWVTPAMDRLFTSPPSERRRFLDRLALALEPAHAHHSNRYEAAMRGRNKLLSEPSPDPAWLESLEAAMAEHGTAIHQARARTISALQDRLAAAPGDDFARAEISLEGPVSADLAAQLRASRARDAIAGRTTAGPHRQDLKVRHQAKAMPAELCSTGEQKSLLLGLVLGHSELVAEHRSAPPMLLLDEVAAHLDPKRRSALFGRLERAGQVWMTGTEAELFAGIGDATRFRVSAGRVELA